jgi:hypothetical protein
MMEEESIDEGDEGEELWDRAGRYWKGDTEGDPKLGQLIGLHHALTNTESQANRAMVCLPFSGFMSFTCLAGCNRTRCNCSSEKG